MIKAFKKLFGKSAGDFEGSSQFEEDIIEQWDYRDRREPTQDERKKLEFRIYKMKMLKDGQKKDYDQITDASEDEVFDEIMGQFESAGVSAKAADAVVDEKSVEKVQEEATFSDQENFDPVAAAADDEIDDITQELSNDLLTDDDLATEELATKDDASVKAVDSIEDELDFSISDSEELQENIEDTVVEENDELDFSISADSADEELETSEVLIEDTNSELDFSISENEVVEQEDVSQLEESETSAEDLANTNSVEEETNSDDIVSEKNDDFINYAIPAPVIESSEAENEVEASSEPEQNEEAISSEIELEDELSDDDIELDINDDDISVDESEDISFEDEEEEVSGELEIEYEEEYQVSDDEIEFSNEEYEATLDDIEIDVEEDEGITVDNSESSSEEIAASADAEPEPMAEAIVEESVSVENESPIVDSEPALAELDSKDDELSIIKVTESAADSVNESFTSLSENLKATVPAELEKLSNFASIGKIELVDTVGRILEAAQKEDHLFQMNYLNQLFKLINTVSFDQLGTYSDYISADAFTESETKTLRMTNKLAADIRSLSKLNEKTVERFTHEQISKQDLSLVLSQVKRIKKTERQVVKQ